MISLFVVNHDLQASVVFRSDEIPSVIEYGFVAVVAYAFYKIIVNEIINDEPPKIIYAVEDSSCYAYKYIMPPNEYEKMEKSITHSDRIKCIEFFWENYGSLNMRNEFESRIKFANENFSNSFKRGWRTDPGRIFLLYGQPEDKVNETINEKSFPYMESPGLNKVQIWYYPRRKGLVEMPSYLREFDDGRMFFVFSEAINGINEQVYSTEPGEKNKISY